jgi:trimethylamine--corrinoid protein Co-methyltransferase
MTGGPKAGTTGPITLSGTLALHNAQILAGIVLTQLVNPGTPIAYGGISGPADLRTGNILYGAPELSKATAAIAQLADYYNLPSRSGGSLTDAHLPDIQAGVESTLALLTAAQSGIHLISYTCGMMGSFLSLNFEKFLIDEELCGKVKNLMAPITITSEEIDLKNIEEVGIGGNYLTTKQTFERCRTEFFSPNLMVSQSYDAWKEGGMKRLEDKASGLIEKRLQSYEKPIIDKEVEQSLQKYVAEMSS